MTAPENQNNVPEDDRPSASELLKVSKRQLRRQGQRRKKKSGSGGGSMKYEESGGWFYQSFLGTASIGFVVLGLIALSIWGIQQAGEQEPEFTTAEAPALISIIDSAKITIGTSTDVSELREPIREESGFSQSYGVTRGETAETLLPAEDLLQRLDSELALGVHLAEPFMYGQYKDGQEVGRFLLFSVTNYRGAYGTLLEKESEIGETLTPLGFPDAREFSDRVIANQDVRVASSADGALFYSFPRQSRLVFATNEATLRAIFERLGR